MELPLEYEDDYFGVGFWVEVDEPSLQLALELWEGGAQGCKPFSGKIANNLPGYDDLIGELVEVQLFDDHRPLLHFLEDNPHTLAQQQREGVSLQQHHKLLEG